MMENICANMEYIIEGKRITRRYTRTSKSRAARSSLCVFWLPVSLLVVRRLVPRKGVWARGSVSRGALGNHLVPCQIVSG